MKKIVSLLLIITLFLVGITACAPRQTQQPAEEAQKEIYVAEAYINAPLPSPQASEEKMGKEPIVLEAYPDGNGAASSQQPQDTAASASPSQAPKADNGQEPLTLVEHQYGKQTLYRINDTNWLTDDVRSNYDCTPALTKTSERLKTIQKNHPNLKIYTYYITRIGDCDWFGKTVQMYDYESFLESLLSGSNITCGKFALPNFNYYMETGYKTDFHVNYKGSDQIYGDVYDMLSKDFSLSARKKPVAELDFDDLYIVGDYIDWETFDEYDFKNDEMDVFKTYKYDVEPYTTYVDDVEMKLGLKEEYEAGQIDRSPRAGHQFIYYGGQTGIVRFEFNQPDKPNLLMVSDSQGRPSRVNIASHFNTTVYIDNVQWRSDDVDVDQLIKDYDIDAVLLIGQRSMFELYESTDK